MIEEELVHIVSHEDEALLAAALEAMGTHGWFEWLMTHEAEVISFLGATQSRRKTLKKWQEPELKPLLALGAYQLVGLAAEVLHATSYLGGGGSWRDNASGAASVGFRIVQRSVFRWPFSEDAPSGWDDSCS